MTRALSAASLTLLACLAACSSAPTDDLDESPTFAVSSAVIKGKPSDASQDAVVLLVHYDPQLGEFGQCTGTMLAPRLVLTARHCVGDTDPYAACTAEGKPIAAGAIRRNHPADTLYVFTGKNRPDFRRAEDRTPDGQGMKILDDGAKNLCNHDIALIVLKEPIEDVPIAPVRLDGDVEVGELITAVGWGVTDETPQPDVRQQRKNVKVATVGPARTAGGVSPNEFEVGESICSGDSGGPGIAQETNAVVGVVSRGGNSSASPDSDDPAAGCIDGRNLYTKISPFKDLILKGYELAEAEPWVEGGPDPRKLKPKAACSSGDDCRSGLCLADPEADNANTCEEDCSATETCTVEGEICTAEGASMVCRAPKPPPTAATGAAGGCSSSPVPTGSAIGGGALVFGLFALASLRRKRA